MQPICQNKNKSRLREVDPTEEMARLTVALEQWERIEYDSYGSRRGEVTLTLCP